MEIVENRRGQLSGPFLSPGDNFSKKYDENRLPYITAGDLRTKSCAAARVAAHADPAVYTRTLAPTKSGFRHNVSKNYPQDLKMV